MMRSIPARLSAGLSIGLFLGFAAGLGASCSDATGSAPAASPDARVAELVAALAPIPETVTSDIKDAHFHRGVELTAELSAAGPEVGRAALRALQSRSGEKDVAIERGLLGVAARAATEDALPLLENLVTQYGPALDLRTEAALLLGEVAPERAIELLRPMLLRQSRNKTTPPVEFLVAAWVVACDKTGRSPVPELCDVATDLFQEGSARVRAVKELGLHPDPRGEKALRAILVESTGDGYLRRKAAQGLRDTLPQETACVLFRQVADKEADLNFLAFLGDMLDKNCGS
jgi:HEAT repeat protein